MKKHYKVHKINNLHDLHWEQKRVRNAYKNIELNWINSIFSPDTIANFFIQSLFSSPFKRNSKEKKKNKGKKPLKTKGNMPRPKNLTFKNSDTPSGKGSRRTNSDKKNYKKLGRTFLIWQIASAVAFVGMSIANHRRKKRKAS